jgi:tRNA-2-methylthio-N6-dimethylallyladenosine synthase
VVAGCAAERLGGKLKTRFPHVNLVVGAKSIDRFQDLLERELPHLAFDGRKEQEDGWAGETHVGALLPGETVTAFVTIMRGCNYSCSYCIVPAVRGPEIYRPARSILSEVRQKAALGLKEVMLLGQTVNSYRPRLPNPGPDGRDVADFADLLRAVGAVPGVRRVRFMSPHPFYLSERVAAAMAETPAVCRHMHLPVQSGADGVLSRMHRNYTRADYLRRVDLLRRFLPDVAVTTDFIVGFPGETEEDFLQTLSLPAEAGIDGAFIFKYSPRPGTASAALADDVPDQVKEERHRRLLAEVEAASSRRAPGYVGSLEEVLVDAVEDGRAEGRIGRGRKVFFDGGGALKAGDLARVEVTGFTGRTLEGRRA